MKIYRSHVNYAGVMVQEVLEHDRQSEDVLRTYTQQHREWGKRDRQFIADLFYALLRHRKFYKALLEKLQVHETSDFLLAGIHLALQHAYTGIHPLWPEFSSEQVIAWASNESWTPDVRHSVPYWLYQRYPQAPTWSAMNEPAALYIRVNTLKTTPTQVEQEFRKEQIAYTSIATDALRIDQKIQLTKHPLFQNGSFEIQDIASQQIVPFLQAEPGMRVLDACAGAGGKSLHLAAAMKNQGSIIATDVYEHKLQQLQVRAERAGATMIYTALLSGEFVQHHSTYFHRILTDVPCSGTGTIRRKPEIKWKLTEQRLHELISLQRNILQQAVSMLQPGGNLVYSTCSILPDENEHQVDWLLQEFPQLVMEDTQRIDPAEGGDGFFMARMKARR